MAETVILLIALLRPGGDCQEMKEIKGSAANEGYYQKLDSKRNPGYEGF